MVIVSNAIHIYDILFVQSKSKCFVVPICGALMGLGLIKGILLYFLFKNRAKNIDGIFSLLCRDIIECINIGF